MLTSYGRLTPAQLFALAIGIVYLAIGLVGFAVTGFNGWFEQGGAEKLLVFPLKSAAGNKRRLPVSLRLECLRTYTGNPDLNWS